MRRGVLAVQQQDGRDLRQRLEHQHARHQRRAGKMPLEELFVDGDVLDRDEPPARLVLGDRVNEHGRIPVAEPVEQDVDVDHRDRDKRQGHKRGITRRIVLAAPDDLALCTCCAYGLWGGAVPVARRLGGAAAKAPCWHILRQLLDRSSVRSRRCPDHDPALAALRT